jgi:Na+-driven multidrug efflux pump
VSLWLAFGLDHGATGLWWGLVVGLALVATVLVIRIKVREGRKIQRLTIDEHADGVSEPRGID